MSSGIDVVQWATMLTNDGPFDPRQVEAVLAVCAFAFVVGAAMVVAAGIRRMTTLEQLGPTARRVLATGLVLSLTGIAGFALTGIIVDFLEK